MKQPKTSSDANPNESVPATGIRAIDLCCGLGGLSLAARDLGIQVVAGVDLNRDALKTFARNFPQAKAIKGSVGWTKVLETCESLLKPASEPEQPCIILSGPPCQGFSAAGSRNPKDWRNKVLVSVARAIARLQPDGALIENVSMVLAEKHGDGLSTFRQVLRDGQYHVDHILLDSSEFGVPQRRKRTFFLVTRQPLDRENVLREIGHYKVPTVTTEAKLEGLPTPAVRPVSYDDEMDYGCIYNHLAMRHSESVKKKIAAILPGTGPMSYRKLHPVKQANTLFSGHRAPPAHYREPRSITVREAARLQGFPDTFRVYGSFANQMEQVTNAVPPPLSRAVLRVLIDACGLVPTSRREAEKGRH